MKKLILFITVAFFSCSKSDTSSWINPYSKTQYTGDLTIGTYQRTVSDYSVKTTSGIYNFNGSNHISGGIPIMYVTKYPFQNYTIPYYSIVMLDYRPDSVAIISFYTASISDFADYPSEVTITTSSYTDTTSISVTAHANISFSNTQPAGENLKSGSFDMKGVVVLSADDTVNFSYKGSFSNVLTFTF